MEGRSVAPTSEPPGQAPEQAATAPAGSTAGPPPLPAAPPAPPPGAAAVPAAIPERIERLGWWLEDIVPIPGTRLRFGLDVILGILPVVGDFAGLALGLPILATAVRHRRPKVVLLAMSFNLLLDALVGSIPLLGNLFDLFWRGHKKNLRLLRDPDELPAVLREAGWKLALLASVAVAMALLMALLVIAALALAVYFLLSLAGA